MIVATAVFSIAMVAVASKLLGAASPATFVPLAFVTSAVLLLSGGACCTPRRASPP